MEPDFARGPGLGGVARALTVAAFPVVCALPISDALAGEDQRLRDVERKLQEVTRELESLKAREADDIDARKSFEELRQSVDKLEALDQRVTQQGVQVRFNEGIHFEDPRGNWALKVGGRVQLDYRNFGPSNGLADTFSLRRVRAGVDATLYKDYRIVVEAEYASGAANAGSTQNVVLTLGYFDIGALGPAARLRIGQFKPAFGYEQTILDLYSDYMERGFGQSLLQNLNYDRGVMVYGAPVPGLWYGMTVANGTGQNLEERQANRQEVDAARPELTGRVTGNLAQFAQLRDKIIQVGTSFKSGTVANSATSPYTAASVQTEGRGATFFTPAAFNSSGGSTSNIDRRFWNFEYLLAAGSVKLQGEHTAVTYKGTRFSPSQAGFKRRLRADYITAMWLVTGEKYADFFRDSTIGKIKPLNRFERGPGNGMGALELGVRYSAFDGTDFRDDNPVDTGRLGFSAPVTSSTNEASAWTLQAKWIPNVYTRFWLDFVRTQFETPIVLNGYTERYERAILLRAQIDF